MADTSAHLMDRVFPDAPVRQWVLSLPFALRYRLAFDAALLGKTVIIFHGKRHPAEMGEAEANAFLTDLAVTKKVSASTQTQALCALMFLYKEVLGEKADWIEIAVRAQRPKRLPVVLTRDEVRTVLAGMRGAPRLCAALLYAAGLRLMECLELRVKDLDFIRNEILVRDGKGQKDRVSTLPGGAKEPLLAHLAVVRRLHQRDLQEGAGAVALPDALARKYPNAAREWGWQWVFPASSRYVDRELDAQRRHHLHESVVQKAVKEAVRRCGISKPATCHSLTTVSPPICWSRATTSGQSRNSWGITMCEQR